MTVRPAFRLAPLLLAAALAATPADAGTKLLRFPDLHGDRVVFTYAGDLWTAPADGGTASRLTAHPGLELFAKFSPDGSMIAFTGQLDGDEQVYVMPSRGGVPTQLTFYPALGPLPPRWGYDHQVHGWTPDGKAVLFRSSRDNWDLGDPKLFTVRVDGGVPEPLPMPKAGSGAFSPDGGRLVYSPLYRDFRHWKRYQGGWAQDLYLFDLETHEATRITDHPRSDRDPMWIGDAVYFTSDRDGTLDLYRYEIGAGTTEQLTRHDVWDLRWPSAGDGDRIVYEMAGELRIYDLGEGSERALEIDVPTDALAMRPARRAVGGLIHDVGLAPGGERALFAARGDVFSVPIEHGPTRNLTRSSGAYDRDPAWSPDGKRVAFVSDRDGEDEIWVVDQAGTGPAVQLTDGHAGRFAGLDWSPDGRYLAFFDQRGKLYVLEVTTRELREIADDSERFGPSYSWSPDGRYLAYALAGETVFRSIWIWSAEENRSRRVTDPLWHQFSPTWDPDGKYLFFLSDREFGPQVGSYEWNYVLDRETRIYALALREDVGHPFPPRSDEVGEGEKKSDESDGSDGSDDESDDESDESDRSGSAPGKSDSTSDKSDSSDSPVRIDFEGLESRVARVPVEPDNYLGVAAIPGHLLYLRGTANYLGRSSDRTETLLLYSLEKREEKTLTENVEDVALAADGEHVLVGQSGGYQLFELPGGEAKSVSTAGLEVDLVPAEEWRQIFDEVWRRFRDYFYVPNMHGYDWTAIRARYEPLLEHVGHRSDLNYLLSEMIAELNVSHAYVTGGDYETPARPDGALLGARFELDEAAGRYRIARIFPGHNEEPEYRSPLTEVGTGVEVGDYVLAIDGVALTADENPYRLLRHAGDPVELLVADRPSTDGARRILVEPIRDEDPLIYLSWILDNRRYVDEKSGGRAGYIHLPNMGSAGIREWIKWFYGQVRKQGLVIDVRANGGGNVSQMIIERLRRELLMLDFERNVDYLDTYPNVVFHGHMVGLLNEETASDGDQFAWLFQQLGLGPLVGKRSWGGVVGIYGGGDLIDGGGVSVPEAGSTDLEGRWIIEGHGVDPDVVVDNDPRELLAGRDQQLERAVEILIEKIENDPKVLPQRPAPPVKTE